MHNPYAAQANTESNEMEQSKLDEIIRKHDLWVNGKEDGERANLSYANLRYADLSYADLSSANLSYADLSSADLSYANLRYANLRDANLRDVNLRDANLRYANLSYADLSYANLSYANLSSADLRENQMEFATGNMSNIKTIQVGVYAVTYTAKVMQIGCQQHDIKDWWKFDEYTINSMDRGTSLEWWKVWKPILKKIIKASPAKPTGYVEPEETI